MAKIEFTEQEASVLLQCIDVVTKQEWIKFAETGLFLTKKIQAEFQKVEETVAEEVVSD